MAQKKPDHLQIPLMYAFREANEARDAKIDSNTYVDGERVLSERAAMRRRGANEAQLKANLERDLAHLANTINLAACVDMEGLEYVENSILNFGLVDLSSYTMADFKLMEVPRQLKAALLAHEPRFVPETMEVTIREVPDEVNQKIAFDINAEMACKPVDIPLEFVAEIDVGAGKMSFNNVNGN